MKPISKKCPTVDSLLIPKMNLKKIMKIAQREKFMLEL